MVKHLWKMFALASALLAFGAVSANATSRLAFEYPQPDFSGVNGTLQSHFTPNLMATWPYTTDQTTIDKQINSAVYGRLQGFVHSWWGPGTNSDSKLPLWNSRSTALSPGITGFRNTAYYECEGNSCPGTPGSPNPTSSQINTDLNDLWVDANNSAWMTLGGKRVLFVYGGPEDINCGMADRWRAARDSQALAGHQWYIVLKVFGGFEACANQPDAWHQYGPDTRVQSFAGESVTISPGFWRADEANARLARGTESVQWAADVQTMRAFTGKFQLVTTWNEWGEGTSVESATQWNSPTGNGNYVARLRVDGQAFGTAIPNTCSDGLDNEFDGFQDATDPDCANAGTTENTFNAAAADTVRPEWPPPGVNQLVASNIGQTSFDLSWPAATDNVGVHHYVVDVHGYAPEPGYLNQNVTGTSVTVTGLACNNGSPDSGHYEAQVYAVDAAGNQSVSQLKDVQTLACSAPPPSDPVVLAAGDIQSPSAGNATSGLFAGVPHDKVITLGDNQYEAGSLANFNSYWAPEWGTKAPNNKIYPAPGNHESTKGGYCSYFTGKAAIADPCPDATSSNRQMYKWTIGSWSFYSLDTGTSGSNTGDLTAAEKTWLDGQLAADTNPCQAVYFHHPRYSAGDHGSNAGLQDDWAMFMTRHVDLVLSGHDHNYQRWNRMNSAGAVDTVNGIRQFVVGTGGHSHYTTANTPVGMQLYNGATYGLLKLTLHANSVDGQFLPQAGQAFSDSWSETCR